MEVYEKAFFERIGSFINDDDALTENLKAQILRNLTSLRDTKVNDVIAELSLSRRNDWACPVWRCTVY